MRPRLRSVGLVLGIFVLAASPFRVPAGIPTASAQALPRVSFVASPGASILVHGEYPRADSPCVSPVQPRLHARYEGTIEVGKASDGRLFVIGVLPFEEYLKGIAEVPRTWPMAALKAQVVAARSYALAHIDNPDPTGRALGYQLCATTACQVYRGLGISAGPYGDRWERAVESTAGEVLLYRGRPADTLYSSTSPGYTIGNDQVFGTDPLPYLRPVEENDDGASPVSRWRVRLPFADIRRFLRAAGHWGSEPVTAVRLRGSNVVVRGGGASETLDVGHFRSHMNFWAHCLDPAGYPSIDTDGTRLPQTVPSIWFGPSTEGSAAVLEGRGWGHGVGMVQWGAYGKAQRGLPYREILASYYGGLRPQTYPMPQVIRVGIAVGLRSVRISGNGRVRVEGRNPGPGPWLVTGGERLRVRRAGPPPTFIAAGEVSDAPRRARVGRTITTTIAVPQLSVVNLVLRAPGPDIEVSGRTTYPPGVHEIRWAVPDLPSGSYRLQAVVTDGVDIVRTPARDVRVTGGTASPTPTPSPSPSATPREPTALPTTARPPAAAPAGGSSSVPVLPLALAALVSVAAALVLLVRWSRRSGPRVG
ncbi:MAG: SpoIID/LytB domain-containing protein [Actinomycetota bacterium]